MHHGENFDMYKSYFNATRLVPHQINCGYFSSTAIPSRPVTSVKTSSNENNSPNKFQSKTSNSMEKSRNFSSKPKSSKEKDSKKNDIKEEVNNESSDFQGTT